MMSAVHVKRSISYGLNEWTRACSSSNSRARGQKKKKKRRKKGIETHNNYPCKGRTLTGVLFYYIIRERRGRVSDRGPWIISTRRIAYNIIIIIIIIMTLEGKWIFVRQISLEDLEKKKKNDLPLSFCDQPDRRGDAIRILKKNLDSAYKV